MLENHPEFEIAFVWNRTKHVLIDCHVAPSLILDKLENIFELEVDLIVEVAHPNITKKVRVNDIFCYTLPEMNPQINTIVLCCNTLYSTENYFWNTEPTLSAVQQVIFSSLTESREIHI